MGIGTTTYPKPEDLVIEKGKEYYLAIKGGCLLPNDLEFLIGCSKVTLVEEGNDTKVIVEFSTDFRPNPV